MAAEPSSMFSNTAKRSFDEVDDSCSMDSCSTIAQPEDDRGYRKKSREKMRRQEVNVKSLKRERDEMRRDRDRLQHEVSKLATCLQYSHLGSVAAANAVAMTQVPHHLSHLNPSTQLSQMNPTSANALANVSQALQQGGACFPIGSGFGNLPTSASSSSSALGASTSSSTSTKIAPKMVKPAPASPFSSNITMK
uniref:Uncharacterized protein n=1 Tax=Globisporangium ultimum (strain ATCC 200006 / CBS 805.95 / DAOM BR144) TaxID=431595 RepID=K3X066_GLOUD